MKLPHTYRKIWEFSFFWKNDDFDRFGGKRRPPSYSRGRSGPIYKYSLKFQNKQIAFFGGVKKYVFDDRKSPKAVNFSQFGVFSGSPSNSWGRTASTYPVWPRSDKISLLFGNFPFPHPRDLLLSNSLLDELCGDVDELPCGHRFHHRCKSQDLIWTTDAKLQWRESLKTYAQMK